MIAHDEIAFGKRVQVLWNDETLLELLHRARERAIKQWADGASVEVRERAWGVVQGLMALDREAAIALERAASAMKS